ncbi:MAG: CysB family HTH-type transcriptional regulator [Rubrivivax sp.]
MNFQQLRSVREAVRQGFNLTLVAEVLHTSQPGVSRQIRELEEELGIELFVRAGKRLTGLTEPGKLVMPMVERLLLECDNLRRAGDEFASQGRGTLTIAATHSQARYALPPAVRDFSERHPEVNLRMRQGTGPQVAGWLLAGEADLGVATEALADYPDLATLPCYQWTHLILVPPGHALIDAAADGAPLDVRLLAQCPIVTYEAGYTGRSRIDEGFARHGLSANVVLEAMDADVIKTYVELGMGVGIVAAIAYDETRDAGLRAIDARHLFDANVTRLAFRRGTFLRSFVYDFITAFAPPLTRPVVEQALVER